MKRMFCLVLITSVLGAGLLATAQAADPSPVAAFMRAKLGHSQKLLEALTTENFEEMAKESQKLTVLTLAEQWSVLQTAEYQQHSREFRRTSEALTAAAQKKNIDAAAFAYVDLTMKCVNCHKYLKQARMAEAPPTEDRLR